MAYKRYILPIGWLYITYHLLGEPETTIETCWVSYCTIDYDQLLSGSPICKHTHTAWVYFIPVGKGWEQGGVVEWPWRTFHSFAVLYLYGCRISRSMKAYMFDVWSSIPRSNMSYLSTFFSLKLTWPLKIGLPPQKKHLPASDFQVLQYVLVSGRVRILDLCCTVLLRHGATRVR